MKFLVVNTTTVDKILKNGNHCRLLTQHAFKKHSYKPQPPYQIREIIAIKEAWQTTEAVGENRADATTIFKASEDGKLFETNYEIWKWNTALSLPQHLVRYFLKVVEIKEIRLNDLSFQDCIDLGFGEDKKTAAKSFKDFWDNKHGEKDENLKWNNNPMIWKIKFELEKGR